MPHITFVWRLIGTLIPLVIHVARFTQPHDSPLRPRPLSVCCQQFIPCLECFYIGLSAFAAYEKPIQVVPVLDEVVTKASIYKSFTSGVQPNRDVIHAICKKMVASGQQRKL